MIELPDKKKCYNLPEQVAQNLRNITFLAEQYKNIDELPTIWAQYKSEFDADIETFGNWKTTFEGWTETLATYLANMSSAAVSAIAGQNIAPANIAATGNITAPSIIEDMDGYSFYPASNANASYEYIYAGVCKNGNKVTFVIYVKVTRTGDVLAGALQLGGFKFPLAVYNKLYPAVSNYLSFIEAVFAVNDSTKVNLNGIVFKSGDGPSVTCYLANTLALNTPYYVRIEETFLLSDNLAA